MESDIRTAVTKYRQNYRSQYIAETYRASYHFAVINAVSIGSIVIASYWAGSFAKHWCLTLGTFLACNFGEWYDHRYHLHSPGAHNRHTLQHHRFFTDRMMAYDVFQDGHAIFFPLREPFFLLGLSLLASLPWYWYSLSAAMTVFRTLMAYYWSYEWLHLAYHSPETSVLGRLPGISYLRRHHQRHHRQALMGYYNFNITLPLADWVFGTCYREDGRG